MAQSANDACAKSYELTIIFLPIIIISIIGIIVIFFRKMPKVGSVPVNMAPDFYNSWLHKVPNKIFSFRLKNIKEKFFNYIEKFLRRFKIVTLRFENRISGLTEKLRRKRLDGKEMASFDRPSVKSDDNRNFIRDLGGALNVSVDENSDNAVADGDSVAEKTEKKMESQNGETDKEDRKMSIMDDNLFFSKERNLLEEIRKNPRNADIYKKLGFLYLNHENLEDAKASFKEAIRLGCRDKKTINALEKMGADF